jgi:SMI1 / KNR4 family (SUKH-1)
MIGPYTPQDIQEVERRLGRPLPQDLADLYAHEDFPQLFEACNETDVVRFLELPQVRLWGETALVGRETLPAEWRDAQFLCFGTTCFGDDLLYCVSPTPERSGVIAVTNHEDDPALLVLGRDLAEWLGRLAEYEGVELAVVPGNIENFPPEKQIAFARSHFGLNPACEWPAEIINAAEPSE